MQGEELDDCFQINLPIKKINEVIFMTSSHILILHTPNQYTLLHVLNRNETCLLKNGKLPSLIENVKRINQQCISFLRDNELHIFNVYDEKSIHTYSIGKSSIYLQQFHYQTYNHESQLFLFYKTSILKGSPLTIYYEIHLISLKDNFDKIKRLKVQHQDLRKFGYSCGQIFSYQLSGYEIQIVFVESGITHKIQSIFNLFLIEVKSNFDDIQLNFIHDELQNQLSSYRVTKKKVMKMERKTKSVEKHTICNGNNLRSLVFKNCYNQRRDDPNVGILRIKITKESKYLHLMENGLDQEVNNEFKQLVLNLLQP